MVGNTDLGYYSLARNELLNLHPWRGGEHVLDIGCGAGGNHRFLRGCNVASVTGIEMEPAPARQAASVYDHVLVGRAESLLTDLPVRPDVVICADILEHLVDPGSLVYHVARLTDPTASLLVSVPNVRHVSVLRMLLLHGQWTYEPAGIMDQTHLRWFTARSIIRLLEISGWRTVAIRPKFNTRRQEHWNTVTCGQMSAFLAEQFLLRAVKQDLSSPVVEPRRRDREM